MTPPVAAAVLGYSKVSIRRILDQEDILSWAWYEADQFHASEVFVSVRSLVLFGLKKGRLGEYEDETPLRAVQDRDTKHTAASGGSRLGSDAKSPCLFKRQGFLTPKGLL